MLTRQARNDKKRALVLFGIWTTAHQPTTGATGSEPIPAVTQAHVDARRHQILDAAESCFSRDGFHRTTMASICREAGLSPGAVYHYFPGKEQIIQAMCEAELARSLAIVGKATQGDTEGLLSNLADEFFQQLDADLPSLCRVNIEIWAESVRNPHVGDAMRTRVDDHLEIFTGIVRRAQELGEIDLGVDTVSSARIMLSSFYGLVLQKALDPAVDVRAYVSALKALHFGRFWTGRAGSQQMG